MKEKHKKTLWDAIERSRTYDNPQRTSHCAIIKINNKTFYGFNKKKSHPLQKRFGSNKKAIYLHAEVDVIRKAYRMEGNISGSILYVARTRADGSVGMSAPCEACQQAIEHFGINRAIFTTNNGIGEIYV
jgi:tRNA(Arg) A34 adenosine deaminase TadA